jgi:uncharacterized protein (DUF488 family)
VEIYTIGFTKKSAREFFELLRAAGVRRLLDTRVNNTSQLAGFTKRDDLAYFLDELVDAEYEHRIDLAPTQELLTAYKKKELDWNAYEIEFLKLMETRRPDLLLDKGQFATAPTVLLCSEHKPDRCHRRLVVEYLAEAWGDDVTARHL